MEEMEQVSKPRTPKTIKSAGRRAKDAEMENNEIIDLEGDQDFDQNPKRF